MLSYLIFTLTLGGIYALLALSLNLIWGGVGMVNLGLAGFFAVGAYASALVALAGVPLPIAMLLACLIGAAAGLLATFATIRLRGDYLAIVTLGFAEVVRMVALNERWLTRGSDGVSGIPAPFRAELGVDGFNLLYLALVSVIVLGVFLTLRRLDLSPFGRVLKAIREDQELATFAGKSVTRFKMQTFALSAAIAGLAGALYGHFQTYISPDHFQPLITIYIFLAVTAGGVGRPVGALAGAYLVVFFLEATRFLGELFTVLEPGQVAAIREVLVGLALLCVLHLRPQGILPERIAPAPKPETSV
ncbi:branched-chain amino acid ABC transporter permease [Rhizobium straminoryzae]|uniref:Branched-chain amino acid ABC transporter permease n=1 Tax=Rhizobium straminoryzae TaxID=1387186 RepID=A0A549TCD8_9HYPH|nr:branched-chain amino acid ABC transporter permease [Rhizobium straminoryzae]TRL39521.1 branched-chain amino acid ABC transporter permease [Rhizobium straminoryzae]